MFHITARKDNVPGRIETLRMGQFVKSIGTKSKKTWLLSFPQRFGSPLINYKHFSPQLFIRPQKQTNKLDDGKQV